MNTTQRFRNRRFWFRWFAHALAVSLCFFLLYQDPVVDCVSSWFEAEENVGQVEFGDLHLEIADGPYLPQAGTDYRVIIALEEFGYLPFVLFTIAYLFWLGSVAWRASRRAEPVSTRKRFYAAIKLAFHGWWPIILPESAVAVAITLSVSQVAEFGLFRYATYGAIDALLHLVYFAFALLLAELILLLLPRAVSHAD